MVQMFLFLFSLFCGTYAVKYLRISDYGFIWFGISILIYLAFRKGAAGIWRVSYMTFSAVLSAALVAGYHLRLDGDMYTGLMYENDLTGFSFCDLAAWVILMIVTAAGLEIVVPFLEKKSKGSGISRAVGICSKRIWFASAAVLFFAWLPYLFVYYPGYIFGDSLASIGQALGAARLNNHHPVVYTLFLRVCLCIGMAVKDITFGCAVYTILQMLYLSLCLGYQVSWLHTKGVPGWGCAAVSAFYGFVPFFAQNSIAMWKDPVFSATVMLWSLLLMDFVLSNGQIAQKKKYFVHKHILCLLIICFLRNNGLYIGLLFEVTLFVIWFVNRKKQPLCEWKKMLVPTALCLLAVAVLTGPVYKKLQIEGEPVESLGIFLNQMARTVSYNGRMSDADRAYMDGLLPLEKYPDTYRPCVVDCLKWDKDFKQDFLNQNLAGFFKTYLSMLVKNPNRYVQSWILNTYGYWALNRWELHQDGNNIKKGNLEDILRNENYGIKPHSLMDGKTADLERIVKTEDPMIALPVITWMIFFLVLLLVRKRKIAWIIVLAPSLGLLATLFIATPHAYWQRYGLAMYDLLPVYIITAVYLLDEHN